MKNQIKSKTVTKARYYLVCLIILSSLICNDDLFAQKPAFSFQITSSYSGNGLGANVCPSISLTKKSTTISIGPNFQKRRFNCSGVQLNMMRTVASSYNDNFELFFSGNITFQNSAYLSRAIVDIEEKSVREDRINFNEIKLSVLESYAGFGLRFYPSKSFSTSFNIGVGGYNTLNNNYDREMFRQKSSIALQFQLCLSYCISKV